jgi:DNA processing protein
MTRSRHRDQTADPAADPATGAAMERASVEIPARGRGLVRVCGRGEDRGPERLARAGLSRLVEPGDPDAMEVIGRLPAIEAWDRLRAGDPALARWLTRMADADPERDLDRAAAAGARFVIPGDAEWPEQLGVLTEAGEQDRRGGAPYGLWVRGPADLRFATARSVAMVGSRTCSSYGQHVTSELAAGLADNGISVVSGGAYGIDAAAHRGALAAAGTTVAFLACGIDVCYPRGHTTLFERIAEQGLLVSELPPTCSPTRLRFLARNRLIAASTLGTVVAEAALRSGALNTARWADQCGRPVLTVPGPITSTMSQGCHILVRERHALLVTGVDDIVEAVSPLGEHLTPYPRGPEQARDRLREDVRRVLDAVPVRRPASENSISTTAGVTVTTVRRALTELARARLVEPTAGGWRLTGQHPSPRADSDGDEQ